MCLFSNTDKLTRAYEKITTFKRVMVMIYQGKVTFLTPYQLTPIPIDVILGKKDFKADGNKEINKGVLDRLYTIHGGFIHTYAFCRDAMKNADLDCQAMGKEVDEIIIECEIPKGTFYIKGRDGYGNIGFAARKVRFTPSENGFIQELLQKYEHD